MEEVAKTQSMATNVTAELDLMERIAKTISTNVQELFVKMEEAVKT